MLEELFEQMKYFALAFVNEDSERIVFVFRFTHKVYAVSGLERCGGFPESFHVKRSGDISGGEVYRLCEWPGKNSAVVEKRDEGTPGRHGHYCVHCASCI